MATTASVSCWLPGLLFIVTVSSFVSGAGGLNDTAEEEDVSLQQDHRTLQMTTPTFSGTQLPTDEDSDYMVKVNEMVCIRATLVASFKVKYVGRKHPKRFIVNETLLTMPKKVKVSGSCTAEISTLTLSWDGGNFSLSFDFRPDNREATPPKGRHRRNGIAKDDDVLHGWSTSQVRFSLNTNDASKFTHPLHPGKYMAKSAPSTHFFWTPRNQSFACRHEQKITLHEYGTNGTLLEQNVYKVVMYIASFQIQGFDLPEDGTFGPSSPCQADIFDTLPKQNIVPIVVAACLACLIIIIVIAYFISKNLGQNAYRAMD